jgi:DNA-binding transcriptional LysR family regulator
MGQTTHYYKGIQLPQLRSFCQVATERNFTAAARMLGLSVPTVWQQVRALERELEVPLLRRTGRAVELTQEGRLLLNLIQPHVSGLDSLLPFFKMRRADLPLHFTVASTSYIISYHLPRAVQEFAKRHHSVRLNLRPGLWLEALPMVERGEADLGVVPFDREEPRSPYLEYEELFETQFMLATPPDHPLAKRKRVQPLDLVQYPIIVQQRRDGYSHRMLARLLSRHNLHGQTQVVVEGHSADAILKYVAQGVGIALLFVGKEIRRSLPGVHFRPIDPEIPGFPVAIVSRKGAHLPEPVEDFRRLLRRFLADHGKAGRH